MTGDTAKASQTIWPTATKDSQPATDREPNRPAGQHRSNISLSLSDHAAALGREGGAIPMPGEEAPAVGAGYGPFSDTSIVRIARHRTIDSATRAGASRPLAWRTDRA